MFSSIFLTDLNTILITMIWCKSRDFQNGFEKFAVDFQEVQTIWKKNGQKQFKKKSLITFFVFREVGQLKGRTLIGGFAVFKLLVVLSITKLYTFDITSSDTCNFLVTGILIRKMLLFSSEKRIDLCFASPVKLLLLSTKFCFSVKGPGGLRNKLIYQLMEINNFYLDKYFHEKCFNKSKPFYS